MSAAGSFLETAVRTATPLAYAALGEAIVERAGVINLGLEGVIVAGAFGAFVGAGLGVGAGVPAPAATALGFAAGALAGLLTAALFALFAIGLRTDQIITGTAVTLAALGATGTLCRAEYGGAGAVLALATSGPLAVPGLAALPLLGRALFAQAPVTYGLYALVPALAWAFGRTHAGLALRAVGERPGAAAAAGVRVRRVQAAAVLLGGALGGVAGATLVSQAGTFAEGMSAGRGFIAIAVVVLGRWRPTGVAGAALLFGAAGALQYLFQALGSALPYQLFLAVPYVLTLVVLAGVAGRAAAPAALGQRALATD